MKTIEQQFLDFAQETLQDDLDHSYLPLDQCGWFPWFVVDIPNTQILLLRRVVNKLFETGIIERHPGPDRPSFVRIKNGSPESLVSNE